MKFRNVILGIFIGALSFNAFSDDSDAITQQKSNSSEELLNNSELSGKLDQLKVYLDKKDYSSARKFIILEKLPPIAVIEVLKGFANAGDTPTMWMLSEQYLSAERFQESANWVYSAFLGTRIDTSLCTNRTATGLERTLVDAYSDVVQKARQDPLLMQSAISFALEKQKSISNEKRDPTWVCKMVRKNGPEIIVSSTNRDYNIKEELDKFEKNTNRKAR